MCLKAINCELKFPIVLANYLRYAISSAGASISASIAPTGPVPADTVSPAVVVPRGLTISIHIAADVANDIVSDAAEVADGVLGLENY